MNFMRPEAGQEPAEAEVREAVDVLRRFAAEAGEAALAALEPELSAILPAGGVRDYPRFSRDYPHDFTVDAAYRQTLPDLQNGPESLIRGSRRRIQHVGIHGFRLPIRFRRADGGEITLETTVTGTVSLEAEKKGINMSRIMRSFYAHAEQTFSMEVMRAVVDAYKRDLESLDARLQMKFSYPIRQESLRSGLSGWQYYDFALELIEQDGERREIVHLDYVYSSTCPCSLELSEHARARRGQLATPHSQRSVARISAVMLEGPIWFEELIELCRRAVPTETQVMVKREDEQAFAELNAANPIFVEDAVRLFAAALEREPRIGDFRVVASHQESLHSHDAVSILTEGDTFALDSVDSTLFASLHHLR